MEYALLQGFVLPFLKGVLPGGLTYGANYLVEFEPQSLWYEASLTVVADALRHGIKTDFHSFTHVPSDIREALRRQVPDLDRLEDDDVFRIWDNYTVQTGLETPAMVGRSNPKDKPDLHSLKIADWDRGSVEGIKGEIDEVDRQRLHVDDNTSILLQYNGEKEFLEHFRTLTVPYMRRFEIAAPCIPSSRVSILKASTSSSNPSATESSTLRAGKKARLWSTT
jgi:hypothetical protein